MLYVSEYKKLFGFVVELIMCLSLSKSLSSPLPSNQKRRMKNVGDANCDTASLDIISKLFLDY